MIKFNRLFDIFKGRKTVAPPVQTVKPVIVVTPAPKVAVASNGKRYHSVRDRKTGRFTKV